MRGVFVALLAGLGGLFFLQSIVDRLLYQPMPGIDLEPEALGIEADSLFLDTEDGVRIHAFYLPSPGSNRARLFLHGNAGNASHRLPNAALLARMRCNVLLLDYRGYGLSDGTPSEEGLRADARAGLAHLVTERGLDTSRVVVFGRSLGGAVAVALARDRPLAGVILESTFSSLADMAHSMLGPLARLVVRGGFDSLAAVPSLRSPVLFFHGDADEVVPYALGRRLYDAAPEPKSFETLAGAGHNDTVQVGGRPYLDRIEAFLGEVAPRETAGAPHRSS